MRKQFLVAVAVIGLVASVVISQEKKDDAAGAAGGAGKMAAMMEQWLKVAAPGPQHEMLKKIAGKFDCDVTVSMTPGMPPEVSKGTQNNRMIMGDRYLRGEYSGTMMGKPFKGMSLMAYDNAKKQYTATWIGDMSTGIEVSEGTGDASGKVINTTSHCLDPMTGKPQTMRQVTTIVDDDHYTYEAFNVPAEGKEFNVLTVKYTRVKQ